MATTVNPYADRATAQMMAAQQPANLFAQQKQTAYPDAVQRRVPGQVVGETPEQFAAARQAANSQGSGYNAQPLMQQPSVQSQPSVVQTPRTVGAGSQYQDARTSISNADELARAMGYTSPEEEERIRKASVANQRIMAVADVYDALISERCYKKAMPIDQALNIIREESGTHFDPQLAEVFLNHSDLFIPD
jgi:hypothetical protein